MGDKAVDSGSTIGVKSACGTLETNLQMKTRFQSCNSGVARGDSNPSLIIRTIVEYNHSSIGDWPSGKASDSGSDIGVKNASGILQGKLHFQTCLKSRSFGPAECRSNPSLIIRTYIGYNKSSIGEWPSGKAVDSGSTIGGSNPSSPAIQKV